MCQLYDTIFRCPTGSGGASKPLDRCRNFAGFAGIVLAGSTVRFLQQSSQPTAQKLYAKAQSNLVKSVQEELDRVVAGRDQFAMIGESSPARRATARHRIALSTPLCVCNVKTIGLHRPVQSGDRKVDGRRRVGQREGTFLAAGQV